MVAVDQGSLCWAQVGDTDTVYHSCQPLPLQHLHPCHWLLRVGQQRLHVSRGLRMALVRPAITPSQVRRLYQPGISLTDAKINIVKYLRGRVVRWGRYRCVTLTSCYICQAPGELINTTTVRIKMCAPPPPTGDITRGVYFPNFGEGLRGKIRIFQPFDNQF